VRQLVFDVTVFSFQFSVFSGDEIFLLY